MTTQTQLDNLRKLYVKAVTSNPPKDFNQEYWSHCLGHFAAAKKIGGLTPSSWNISRDYKGLIETAFGADAYQNIFNNADRYEYSFDWMVMVLKKFINEIDDIDEDGIPIMNQASQIVDQLNKSREATSIETLARFHKAQETIALIQEMLDKGCTLTHFTCENGKVDGMIALS